MEHQELIAIAKPIVWRRGYQSGLSLEDREDLLQDVLMKYLNAWPAGSAPGNVEAWFETTTANAIVDRLREVGRRPADNFAEGGEDPVSLAIAAMRSTQFASAPAVSQKLLHAVFSLVPEHDAHLLRRRYLRNYTAAEIAEELGISVANVDQRTTRAKRKLRDALAGRSDLVAELRRPHPHVY
jgi:RNA polymerase sigma-70 factor (ECF subfamily)